MTDEDVDDDLSETWDEMEGAEQTGRARDERGRFAQRQSESVEAPIESQAPHHWSQEDKDNFAALPDEVKPLYMEKVRSLESGYNRKFEEIATDRKHYEAGRSALEPLYAQLSEGQTITDYLNELVSHRQRLVDHQAELENQYHTIDDEQAALENYRTVAEKLEPYEDELIEAGLTPQEYVGRLVSVGQALQSNPRETLLFLAQQYGVDLYADATMQVQHQNLEREWASYAQSNPSAAKLQKHIGQHLAESPPQPNESMRDAIKRGHEAVKWLDPEVREADRKAHEEDLRRKQDLAKARRRHVTVKTRGLPVTDRRPPAPSWKAELEHSWSDLSDAG